MGQLTPDAMTAFKALDLSALAEGTIPKKYQELTAIAVALTTQCPYCIQVHRRAALAAGVTDVELTETVFFASALRAGAAITHGTQPFP